MSRPFQFSLGRLLGAVTFLSLAGASLTAGPNAPNPLPGLALGFSAAGAALGAFLDGWRGSILGAMLSLAAFGLWASSLITYMPGRQFTPNALLLAILVVAAFLVPGAFMGGIGYERKRKGREEKEAQEYRGIGTLVPAYPDLSDDSPKDSGDTTVDPTSPESRHAKQLPTS